MPAKRELTMRQIRQMLRLAHDGVSIRAIGQTLGAARSTIQDGLQRSKAIGLTWPLPADLTDAALEERLYARAGQPPGFRRRPEPDWAALAFELKRPGVNLMVLWEEYREVHPDGYGYSRFCDLFREFERRLSPTMRQHHVAGNKVFVDYSGKKLGIVNRDTGEVRDAELFVAVLGASSYLRRSLLVAGVARLDRQPCPSVPLLWRRAPPGGLRQSEVRRQQGQLLRSRAQPFLWRDGIPLRRRRAAGAALQGSR
ncbi:hypothetical protein ACETRX_36255 [Labrys portucalensis]|uniref:HTH IS408-type domain-containing protein n=1 Tax=Labrys neptuniae TaxID=376174 RepID=A0ABV6ZSB9_9HYPH